jgi:hypothetical protein
VLRLLEEHAVHAGPPIILFVVIAWLWLRDLRTEPEPGDAQRLGKAIGAVKHSIIVAVWHMLSTGELYHDLGPDLAIARLLPAEKPLRDETAAE